jgi:hypothetical protein
VVWSRSASDRDRNHIMGAICAICGFMLSVTQTQGLKIQVSLDEERTRGSHCRSNLTALLVIGPSRRHDYSRTKSLLRA